MKTIKISKQLIILGIFLISLSGCEGQPRETQEKLTSFFIAIGVILVLFLLLRDLILWYYKINESIKIQKAQLFMLKKIFEQNGKLTPDEEKEVEKIIKKKTQ